MAEANRAWVAATLDTKGEEAEYVCGLMEAAGLRVVVADLSTSGGVGQGVVHGLGPRPHGAEVEYARREVISAAEIARSHPSGAGAVFCGDRGAAIAAMGEAFERFVRARNDVGGMLGLGGSGGTAMIARAMRALAVGVPKVMVSTMAAGNVGGYVGASDMTMMYSVTDLAGLNRISRRVLGNAANALAGMMQGTTAQTQREAPGVGLTMFGVTTACVQETVKALTPRFECVVFHATGTGGQSMEKLLDDGLLVGVLDITTTEVCDHLFGGVLACTDDRFGAVERTRAPYVGSCGALDMVNFGAPETVPERYGGRKLYAHNPQITLMRTTVEENVRQGRWIAERLNKCEGQVRFLLPLGGVSALDAPGKAFWDPAADKALFETFARELKQTERRKLLPLPYHINDARFAHAAAEEFAAIAGR